MLKKILIANRSEIALRVIKTLRKLNIISVAVFTKDDLNPLILEAADEAFCLPKQGVSAYLDVKDILRIAKQANVDAIHPGYGFLAENASFAKACAHENIIFIGPNPDVIHAMGNKSEAKALAESLNIPTVPGYNGADQNITTLKNEAKKIGTPLLIKAQAGGGGKGMRIVETLSQLEDAIKSAQKEALNSFKCDKLILEKYIKNPRHIEVQIIADNYGNVVHLYDRECSIQRRYQKIIEEAPAVAINSSLRNKMYDAAINLAQNINYTNTGTIEFLCDNKSFYFLEMNTRLQVEHPVTEAITGLDIVHQQIQIAANEKLSISQDDIKSHGYAIEARVCAESPENNFLPSTGTINYLSLPTNIARIESALYKTQKIGIYYDSMLAKIITHEPTREQAINSLHKILHEFYLFGVEHNGYLLKQILKHSQFLSNDIHTHFIKLHLKKLLSKVTADKQNIIAALAFIVLLSNSFKFTKSNSPWQNLQHWRLNHQYTQNLTLFDVQNSNTVTANINYCNNIYKIELEAVCYNIEIINIYNDIIVLNCNNQIFNIRYNYNLNQPDIYLSVGEKSWHFQDTSKILAVANSTIESPSLNAPMPGSVTKIYVQPEDIVKQGDKLIALEAMKMEHMIYAPKDGKISDVFFSTGDIVEQGATLVAFALENK